MNLSSLPGRVDGLRIRLVRWIRSLDLPRLCAALIERGRSGASALYRHVYGWLGSDLPAWAVCLPSIIAFIIFILAFFFAPPTPETEQGLSTAVYSRDGVLLGASVSADGQWKFPRGAALPRKFTTALLRFEDRHFYSHPGVDALAIGRAFIQNARAGHIVSGGSTITMQAARLSLPPGERSLGRKMLELWLALRYEVVLGKQGILELYAANAPFGGNVVGLEAASFRYFGQPPDRLSWAESATLAVLPNAPSAAHPGKNRGLLLAKRDRLLRSLRDAGELSEDELELALAEPLPPAPFPLPRLAPQLLDRVKADSAKAEGRTGGAGSGAAGLRLITSIDSDLQERTAGILERHHRELARRGIYNAACIVARVDTGEVLAYVGNVGMDEPEDHGQHVDLCLAPRSSGSILKPFLYAAMLDSGDLTPKKLVADIPTRVGSYNPENNVNAYSGALPAEEALARSLNVPFVRLLRSYGVNRFLRLLQGTGISTMKRDADEYGLTLILGGAEVSLWEMAGRYAALARTARGLGAPDQRQYFDLVYLPQDGYAPAAAEKRSAAAAADSGASVKDAAESPIRRRLAARSAHDNPFSQGAAWLTLETLLKVQRPAEEASWEEYASGRRIAWKTGTSFGLRDAWAIGVNYDYIVAVWVGNADGEGVPGLRGSEAAAPLLFDVFAALPFGRWFPEPEKALRRVDLCAKSGCLAGPDCEESRSCLVPRNAPAAEPCPYCRLVHLSLDGQYRVDAGSSALSEIKTQRVFVLPPTMEWYYKQNHLDYRVLPPWKPGTGPHREDNSGIAIVAPEEGAQIYVPIEISGQPGATIFSAADSDPGAVLYWHLDGDYLGSTKGRHSMEARPGEGSHVINVVDGAGRSTERRFNVLSDK